MPKFVFLPTDLALYAQLLVLALYVCHALRTPLLRQTWRYVSKDAAAMCAGLVLLLFLLVALLDSVHFRPLLPPSPVAAGGLAAPATGASAAAPAAPAAQAAAYSTRTLSLLDVLLDYDVMAPRILNGALADVLARELAQQAAQDAAAQPKTAA